MALSHHYALAVGYAAALIGWAAVFRVWRGLWPPPPDPAFARPWREVAWAGVGVVGVLVVGQLYSARLLLPRGPGGVGVLAECVNQALIFAPIVLVPLVRHHPPATAWVRTDRLWARLAVGIALALVATVAFVAVRADADAWPRVVTGMVHPRQLPIAIQVLLEDVAVAILVVRLAVATRPWIAVVATAALFAAGHVPALLTAAAPASQLFDLVLDFALAAGMLAVARRSADVTWLWCVHFTMDSMQWFAVRP